MRHYKRTQIRATQYAPPSAVLGYTALQPLTSSVLVLIITSLTSKYDLTKPGYNMLGALIIVLGLYLLIASHLKEEKEQEEQTKICSGDEEVPFPLSLFALYSLHS